MLAGLWPGAISTSGEGNELGLGGLNDTPRPGAQWAAAGLVVPSDAFAPPLPSIVPTLTQLGFLWLSAPWPVLIVRDERAQFLTNPFNGANMACGRSRRVWPSPPSLLAYGRSNYIPKHNPVHHAPVYCRRETA